MEYGLIGEKLGHSFSKIIHESLADYTYELCPLPPEQLKGFMTDRAFRAINVTIPYKRAVLPFLDEIDEAAKEIGAVNTVVNRDGKLWGYNTDYLGFLYGARSHNVDFAGKEVLLLGNGGAAQAVKAAARTLGAETVYVASRTPDEDDETSLAYEDLAEHFDIDIIVNCTPVGMFPDVDKQVISLRHFSACQAVFDLIYNPLKTRLLKEAEEMGITAVNGLPMLVAQAKYASELFTGKEIPDSRIDEILLDLTMRQSNIVLIGMPSCGKTLTGMALQNYMDKKFVDTDAEIVKETGMEIREIFKKHGEEYFRKLESEVIAELSKGSGQIIATGGGAVKDPQNMLRLKQNGVVVFIDRELKNLISTKDRPLSSSREAVAELYRQRYPLYLSYGDFRIENNYMEDELTQEEMDRLMGEIIGGYRAVIGTQWT